MKVSLNDQAMEAPEACNLAEFLLLANLHSQRGIAVARNGTVVPRAAWDNCRLGEGDELLVIRPSQGG